LGDIIKNKDFLKDFVTNLCSLVKSMCAKFHATCLAISSIDDIEPAILTLKVPMSDIPDMTLTSLAVAVAPRTGKIIKNGRRIFERGENLLQNSILHSLVKLRQSSEIVLQNYIFHRRKTFLKGV